MMDIRPVVTIDPYRTDDMRDRLDRAIAASGMRLAGAHLCLNSGLNVVVGLGPYTGVARNIEDAFRDLEARIQADQLAEAS